MRFSSPRLSSWLDGAVAANTALAPVPEDGDVDAVGAGASGGVPSVAEAGGDACDRDQAAVAVVVLKPEVKLFSHHNTLLWCLNS